MPKLPKLSTLPLDKPFTRLGLNDTVLELAPRLVVNFYSDEPTPTTRMGERGVKRWPA